MKHTLPMALNSAIDKRLNPFRDADHARRPSLALVLTWTWSTIFAVAFLAMTVVEQYWIAHLLIVAGVLATMTAFKNAKKRRRKQVPAPYLSGASKCVWQMDREA